MVPALVSITTTGFSFGASFCSPAAGTLYTYNGHCFDLICLRQQLGLDLRACFASVDLRWVCQRRGLRGGQKAIEKSLGHRRLLPDLDGRDALLLWARYQRGDR